MVALDGPRWGPGAKPGTANARQLVVLCHGVGADGHDLIDLAPHWAAALPDAAFVAPDAPERYDGAPSGRQWFSLADRTPAVLAKGAGIAAASLDAFIAHELNRLGLPRASYALVGFSQGAMMALYAGLRAAPPPCAILAYSGALLSPESLPDLASRPPVLLVHGEADETVPATRSRGAEAALRNAGYPVEALYRKLLGHGIDEAGLGAGASFLQRAFAGD